MDLLSDVVASLSSGTPGAARIGRHGNGGWYLPGDAEAAGFLAVLEGSCWLFPHEVDEPTRVDPGEVVLSPHGDGYGLAAAPSGPDGHWRRPAQGEEASTATPLAAPTRDL